jgi:hypothetical protein
VSTEAALPTGNSSGACCTHGYRRDLARSFVSREQLIDDAFVGVNEMLENDQCVDSDVRAGLKDLQALGLISFSADDDRLIDVADDKSAVDMLKSTWSTVFDGKPVGMASLRNQTFVQ